MARLGTWVVLAIGWVALFFVCMWVTPITAASHAVLDPPPACETCGFDALAELEVQRAAEHQATVARRRIWLAEAVVSFLVALGVARGLIGYRRRAGDDAGSWSLALLLGIAALAVPTCARLPEPEPYQQSVLWTGGPACVHQIQP